MRTFVEHEYLFTVRVTKTGEIKQVQARTMAGVALLLKLDIDAIVYVNKQRLT